jgi:hypothetical protein
LVVLLAVSALQLINLSKAQTVTKPSIPDYTLKLVSHPYDVAPVTTIDPYTGKTVTTQQGFHVENQSVEITIKNQALPKLDNGNYASLYYNVSYKGHFATDWNYIGYSIDDDLHLKQSNADYTVISFASSLPVEGQMDFRVQAQIGQYFEVFMPCNLWINIFTTLPGKLADGAT